MRDSSVRPVYRLTFRGLTLALACGAGCGAPDDMAGLDSSHDGRASGGESRDKDLCDATTAPIATERWNSGDPRFGLATFMFYDFSKSSRTHQVPILGHPSRVRVYVIEVGSQSRDPRGTHILYRTTTPATTLLGSGGSTDKYQRLHEVTDSASSVAFHQPEGKRGCIRDEGQYVVVYAYRALGLVRATMRDPELSGNNQYAGAPDAQSFSLIADDETNQQNRVKPGGATRRMLDSADYYAFEDQDNGFFLYKFGSKVPTFNGNGCDAQYRFY